MTVGADGGSHSGCLLDASHFSLLCLYVFSHDGVQMFLLSSLPPSILLTLISLRVFMKHALELSMS